MNRLKWYLMLNEDVICPIFCRCNETITEEIKNQMNKIVYQHVVESSDNLVKLFTKQLFQYPGGKVVVEIKAKDSVDFFAMTEISKSGFSAHLTVEMNHKNSSMNEMKDEQSENNSDDVEILEKEMKDNKNDEENQIQQTTFFKDFRNITKNITQTSKSIFFSQN